MNIVGTGMTGLVGSRLMELMPDYSFTNISKETGYDITDRGSMDKVISASDAPWVFHLAAYTDVQGAEKEREQGQDSISWKVNVDATETIAGICDKTGKRMLYISTDYVFDGKAKTYDEESAPNPQGWYAITKYEGEKRVSALKDHALIVRISNPYRARPVGKMDFVHKMAERLKQGLPIQAPDDQIFVPTFIDDLAHALSVLVPGNRSGVWHVVGRDPISPYDAAKAVALLFALDDKLVTTKPFAEYFAGRAAVPQNAHLTHAKIDGLGIKLHSFAEGLSEIVKQESEPAV